MKISMEDKYIGRLKEEVLDFLREDNVKVVLFGSRARKSHYPSSDVDIGIIPADKIDDKRIAVLRDKVDDLNIPYKVELVNFADVSDDFRAEALKEVLVWKDWN